MHVLAFLLSALPTLPVAPIWVPGAAPGRQLPHSFLHVSLLLFLTLLGRVKPNMGVYPY